MQLIKTIIAILLIALPAWGYEDLTELEARVTRKDENTFYSGEDSGNYYIWQPMTVIYQDQTSGHEVMVLTSTRDSVVFNYARTPEYGYQLWSADGKRIAFHATQTVGNFTPRSGDPWFVSRSDGSYLRPFSESPNRSATYMYYYNWSPTEADTAWHMGCETSGVAGETDTLYKVSFTDTSGSAEEWYDIDTGTDLNGKWKNAITSDGKLFITSTSSENTNPYYIVNLESKELKGSYTWPTMETYWGDTPSSWAHLHDQWFVGNDVNGYWIWAYITGTHTHWRARPWGTDGNAPTYSATDTSAPYDWWNADEQATDEWDSVNNIPSDANKEMQVLCADTGNIPAHFADPSNCDPGEDDHHYFSHNGVDRYGRATAFSDTECYYPRHFTIWDVENAAELASNPFLVNYVAWSGFSDYAVGVKNNGEVAIMSIGGDSTYHWVCDIHTSGLADVVHPSQSPDGTKAAIKGDWLNPTKTGSEYTAHNDLYVPVLMYPYPPEITSCTATGGTVTTTFEWMLDGASPRVYNSRGWPDPDTDYPPPPRETSKFRLWRKASTSENWTPITTTNAEIFTRYDFSDGTWSGNDYWTITDTPGDGTWDYAVTSIEWSGLESHCVSNVYRITVSGGSGNPGTQQTAYPADPGCISTMKTAKVTSTYQSTCLRHYNIYAADDGATPTATQAMRIASIPATYDYDSDGSFSWVDWLGDTDGSTKYIVTAVDTQGNESSALSTVTYTHKDGAVATADGQYLITWEDGGSSPSTPSFTGVMTGSIR